MRLYKYAPLARIDILLNEAIRYTQPSALNDPYEMRLDFISLTPNDYSHFRDLIEAYGVADKAEKFYDQMPSSWRSVFPGTKDQFVAELLRLVRDPDRYCSLAKEGASIVSYLSPAVNSEWLAMMNQQLGVLSLSEVPDNLLMWSHYADQHKGIVIEFDSGHQTFNCKRKETDEFYHCRKVVYSDVRPTILSNHDAVSVLLTKAVDWSYEREWRIMKSLKDAKTVVHDDPFPIHLLEMPSGCVKRVIFGAGVSSVDVAHEAQRIRAESKLSHIRRIRATLKIDEFGLDLDAEVLVKICKRSWGRSCRKGSSCLG